VTITRRRAQSSGRSSLPSIQDEAKPSAEVNMTHHEHEPLDGKRAAVMIGPLFEDMEAAYPYYRLKEAGATVELIGIEGGTALKGKQGIELTTDQAAADLIPDDLDLLVIAGGFGPDKLRTDDGVKALVRGMHEAEKPIAFICHAGWVPISAKILKGKRATSVRAIKDDMENAGVIWEDAAVVVDGNLISSRTPADLPDFCKALIAALRQGPQD
jgi:protease I